MLEQTLSIKVVLLGDGSVGKTSLLTSYTSGKFTQQYIPTIFDNYTATTKYKNQLANLCLWDTAGQEEYGRLRSLSYPNTDVFLICFSLVDAKSYCNALNKWLRQVNQNSPNAIKIFVGTKSDLYRGNQNYMNISHGPFVLPWNIMKEKIKANGFNLLKCSALCQDSLTSVFDQVIRQVLLKKQKITPKKKQQMNCCLTM